MPSLGWQVETSGCMVVFLLRPCCKPSTTASATTGFSNCKLPGFTNDNAIDTN